MPKISAPTVAEHRARQREALLTAGADVLLESGLTGVTPAAIAKRAGLARSSFYEYFPSATDLLTEIAVKAFDEWATELDALVTAHTPGQAQLETYVRSTIQMVADGKHRVADAMNGAGFSEEQSARFQELHIQLTTPLRRIVRDLALPEPRIQGELIQGIVDAAVKLVNHGADPGRTTTTALMMVTSSLPR